MILNDMIRAVHAATENAIRGGDWNRYEGKNSQALAWLLAERVEQPFVQLTSSGTAALEIILRAAGVGASDEVMLSSYDYPGNFWAIERAGARPVLLDTEPSSWRVSQQSLNEVFEPACKALVISHLHGQLQHIDQLLDWCNARNVLLIEDVCQALGASWLSKPVGSYGHAAIFSFGGGKLLSCGRGGAWATSNEALAIKARVAAGAGSGPYTISELQAAATRAQWPWLDAINESCRAYFRDLNLALDANNQAWRFAAGDCLKDTAFYQCGWIMQPISELERQTFVSALRELPLAENEPQTHHQPNEQVPLPFGSGFPGFHRRSRKRCRIDTSLANATESSERTLVLHHGIVLQQKWQACEIATWIKRQLDAIKNS